MIPIIITTSVECVHGDCCQYDLHMYVCTLEVWQTDTVTFHFLQQHFVLCSFVAAPPVSVSIACVCVCVCVHVCVCVCVGVT